MTRSRVLAWAAFLLAGVVSHAALAQMPPAGCTSGGGYRRLLDAAKANPAATDWTALRACYAASPAYDPAAGHTPAEAGMAASLQKADFRTVAALADQATARNWMDLRAHVMGMLAYGRMGDAVHAAVHKNAALGLFRAITATGVGASPETAIHVLATSEEYVLLLFMHAQSTKQVLVRQDGHVYDALSIVHSPDGKASTIWFNVDTSLARETAVALGKAVPVPEAQLPP